MHLRLIRYLMALAFLLTASLSAVAEAHALCDQAGPAQHQHVDGHQHPAPDAGPDLAQHGHAEGDDSSNADSKAADFATNCHGGMNGCAGCAAAAETVLAPPHQAKTQFALTAMSGTSREPTGNLRPPKLS